MRATIIAAALLALMGAACAGEDQMASRYANTTIATDPDGTQTKLYYRPDHSFTAKRGDWSSDGSWAIEDGKLCLNYKIERPGVGMRECVSAEAHKIGEKWVHNGRTVTLVEGIQ